MAPEFGQCLRDVRDEDEDALVFDSLSSTEWFSGWPSLEKLPDPLEVRCSGSSKLLHL